MTIKQKLQIKFALIILLAIMAGLISYSDITKKIPKVYDVLSSLKINLGLDLQGGIHMEYKADVSQVESAKVGDAMQAVQDVIERRVNAFGVAEPVIYTAKSGSEQRLIVELAGVKDINQAKQMIQETPFLEFKEQGTDSNSPLVREIHAAHILIRKKSATDLEANQNLDEENAKAKQTAEDLLKRALSGEDFSQLAKDNSEDPGSKDNGGDLGFLREGATVPEFDKILFQGNLKDGEIYPQLVETQFGWHIIKKIEERKVPDTTFVSTGLTGKNLKSSSVEFQSQGLSEPVVSLKFDDEGTKLFADITKRNLGKPVAIYLDGNIISHPTVQAEITNGQAIITGMPSIDEAKKLALRLNEGALPVPITLVSQQSVEATLGQISLEKSLRAGIIGLILVIIFMLVYYRFLGLIASFALLIYTAIMISIFKLSGISPWQITLTLPGIAGFILSIGMAVDANILIFERTKEEIRKGRNISGAIEEGFKRAWTSIRDGNVSSIITALILAEMGTGFVKGFAVTLLIGVVISMFTAIVISRTILRFLMGEWIEDKLWLIGIEKKNV